MLGQCSQGVKGGCRADLEAGFGVEVPEGATGARRKKGVANEAQCLQTPQVRAWRVAATLSQVTQQFTLTTLISLPFRSKTPASGSCTLPQ
jgi:hypothetical protein